MPNEQVTTKKQQLIALRDAAVPTADLSSFDYFYVMLKYVEDIAKICLPGHYDNTYKSCYEAHERISSKMHSIPHRINALLFTVMKMGEPDGLDADFFEKEMKLPQVIVNEMTAAVMSVDELRDAITENRLDQTNRWHILLETEKYFGDLDTYIHHLDETRNQILTAISNAIEYTKVIRQECRFEATFLLVSVARHVQLKGVLIDHMKRSFAGKPPKASETQVYAFYFEGCQSPVWRLELDYEYEEGAQIGIVRQTLLNSRDKPTDRDLSIIHNIISTATGPIESAEKYFDEVLTMLKGGGIEIIDKVDPPFAPNAGRTPLESKNYELVANAHLK